MFQYLLILLLSRESCIFNTAHSLKIRAEKKKLSAADIEILVYLSEIRKK